MAARLTISVRCMPSAAAPASAVEAGSPGWRSEALPKTRSDSSRPRRWAALPVWRNAAVGDADPLPGHDEVGAAATVIAMTGAVRKRGQYGVARPAKAPA